MTTDAPTLTHSTAGLELTSSSSAQPFVLPEGATTIGAGPKCDLRLDAPGVRPLHCVVVNDASGVTVRRWAAGAKLNGKAFTEAPLRQGDCLTIGDVEIRVSAAEAPQPLAASFGFARESEISGDAAEEVLDATTESSADVFESAAGEPAGATSEPAVSPPIADVGPPVALKTADAPQADAVEQERTPQPMRALNPIPAHLLKPWNAANPPASTAAPDTDAVVDCQDAQPEAAEAAENDTHRIEPAASPSTGHAAEAQADLSPAEEVSPLADAAEGYQYYTDVDWSVGAGQGCHNPATPVAPPELRQPTVLNAAEQASPQPPRPEFNRARARNVIAALRRERAATTDLQEQLQEQAADRTQLEERLSRLEAELANSDEARREHDAQEQALEAEIATLKASNHEFQSTLSELKPRLESLAATVAKLEEQKVCWYAERAQLNERLEEALQMAAAAAVGTAPSQASETPESAPSEAAPPADMWTGEGEGASAGAPVDAQGASLDEVSEPLQDAAAPDWGLKPDWQLDHTSESPAAAETTAAEPAEAANPADWGSTWDSPVEESPTAPEPPAAPSGVTPGDAEPADTAAEDAGSLWGDMLPGADGVDEPQQTSPAAESLPEGDLWSFGQTSAPTSNATPEPAAAEAVADLEQAARVEPTPAASESTDAEQHPDSVEFDNGQGGYWIDSFADGNGLTDDLGHGATEVEDPAPEAEQTAYEEPKSFYEQYAHLLEDDNAQAAAAAPAAPAPVHEAPPQAAAATADEDEDIDAYMARLMERMRGGEPAATAAPTPNKPSPAPTAATPAPMAASPQAEQPKPGPLMSLDEIKKSSAPERGADLDSLRMLANQSARQAIGVAASKQNKERSITNFVIACIALASGGFLMASASEVMSLQMLGGTVALSGSGVWVVRSLKHLISALRPDSGREKLPPKKPASDALPIVKDQPSQAAPGAAG